MEQTVNKYPIRWQFYKDTSFPDEELSLKAYVDFMEVGEVYISPLDNGWYWFSVGPLQSRGRLDPPEYAWEDGGSGTFSECVEAIEWIGAIVAEYLVSMDKYESIMDEYEQQLSENNFKIEGWTDGRHE